MVRFKHPNTIMPALIQPFSSSYLTRTLAVILLIAIYSLPAISQSVGAVEYKSQEVSEVDGLPVLLKHLPDWESAKERATFATNAERLKDALGQRPYLDEIDFTAGTEAVTAPYDSGKLLIIEYSSAQASIEADTLFTSRLDQLGDANAVYRRIGNYNVFVFDAVDPAAANALIDQVKYEKQIHWLGDNPFHISAERAFVLTTADLFLSTVMIIVIGIGFSILGGIVAGYLFYHIREHRRSQFATFSDAGGMTRLNLDGYTPDISRERLLKD